MTNTIKGIVFDLYGVNVHRDDARTIRAFAERTNSTECSAREAIDKAGRNSLKLGQITPRKFVSLLNKRLNSDLSIQETRLLWNSTLTIDEDMKPLLSHLGQRFPLFLLSNLNDLDWQAILQTELPEYFQDLFLSFELGFKKPDPRIFQEVVDITGIPANKLLFIDDQAKNTNAATELGMLAVQFTNAQQLSQQLSELNLL